MPAIAHVCSADQSTTATQQLFARAKLIAGCIVSFDAMHRGPEERVGILKEPGITKFASNWRAEHLPTFEEELGVLLRHKIELTASRREEVWRQLVDRSLEREEICSLQRVDYAYLSFNVKLVKGLPTSVSYPSSVAVL